MYINYSYITLLMKSSVHKKYEIFHEILYMELLEFVVAQFFWYFIVVLPSE